MTNPSESQKQRSQYNPLNLGTFDQTTLRLLTGSLGMRSRLITGGYGDYTYNHWFQITLPKPAWIILVKGGTELITSPASASSRFNNIDTRFDFSVYAQDYSPIEGRSVLQEPERFFGYVAGAQSDLYNTFNPKLDSKGNEMLYELTPGNYLVCVSATRNEAFDYALGLVIEFADNEENFIFKSGFQRTASQFGVAVCCPDTSPRGLNLPGEDDSYDFGTGAGFYVDATLEPYSKNYNMYSYVAMELPDLVTKNFPVDSSRMGIFGHSMGGHGALTIALKNPDMFRSVSAFSPICVSSGMGRSGIALPHVTSMTRSGCRVFISADGMTVTGTACRACWNMWRHR